MMFLWAKSLSDGSVKVAIDSNKTVAESDEYLEVLCGNQRIKFDSNEIYRKSSGFRVVRYANDLSVKEGRLPNKLVAGAATFLVSYYPHPARRPHQPSQPSHIHIMERTPNDPLHTQSKRVGYYLPSREFYNALQALASYLGNNEEA